jgi:hypothetical protein
MAASETTNRRPRFAWPVANPWTIERNARATRPRAGGGRRARLPGRTGGRLQGDLRLLREEGRLFIVGTPRSELKNWEKDLVEKDGWREVRQGLETKLCPGPDGVETFILCRSADRAEKEKAMHQRFSKRIAEGLVRLSHRLEKAKKAADRSQVEHQIGRLLGRNSRAAGRFAVEVTEDASRASGLQ